MAASNLVAILQTPENDGRETRWSLVLRACTGSVEAAEAVARTYWPVVYAFLLRKGLSPEDAQDLTQETFGRLLKDGRLAEVSPSKGRFRSFLYACAAHEALHFHERNRAEKRGANQVCRLEMADAEEHGLLISATDPPDERSFDRAWSKLIVGRALAKLGSEYGRIGKEEIFKVLVPLLSGGTERGDVRSISERLGISEGNARITWMRFKGSFIKHVRDQVAETIADESEVDAELRHLMGAWLSSDCL